MKKQLLTLFGLLTLTAASMAQIPYTVIEDFESYNLNSQLTSSVPWVGESGQCSPVIDNAGIPYNQIAKSGCNGGSRALSYSQSIPQAGLDSLVVQFQARSNTSSSGNNNSTLSLTDDVNGFNVNFGIHYSPSSPAFSNYFKPFLGGGPGLGNAHVLTSGSWYDVMLVIDWTHVSGNGLFGLAELFYKEAGNASWLATPTLSYELEVADPSIIVLNQLMLRLDGFSSGFGSADNIKYKAIESCNLQASISANGNTTFCQGGSVTLTASSGSSYLWSNGQTSQSITVIQTGTYSVQVTDNGCSATSQSVSVTVTNPTASISTNGLTTFCQGGSITLTASSGDSYLWSNGQTTQSITVTQTDSYSVEVTENSCSATSQPTTVTVIVNPTATVTTSGATTFCQGGNVTLTASSGSSYLWSNGQATQSISASQTGTYSVQITDNGCSATSQSVAVTVLSNPVVTLSSFSDICSNANPLTLTGGNPSGGVYSVNSTQSSVFDPSITGVGMQTVSYTYANQNNCSGTATGTVNVLASPSVSLSGLNSNYSLSDNPSILTVSPSGGVLSGNGVSNGEFDPSNAGLGTHSVLYMYVDGNGCMGGDALCTNVDLNVGIDGTNQIATGGGIEIYPNPSSGLYSLSFEIEGVVSYSVFDSRGREIVNESFVSNGSAIKTLDLTKYSSGVYAVQVQTPKGGVIDKLIKE